MTVIAPRVARLTVGPPGGVGFTWGADPASSKRPLYWEAEIEKTSASAPSKVKVEVSNLSPASIALVEMPGNVLQIVAGEGTPSQLCYADIPKRGVKTEDKAPDSITTIKAAEGQRIYREGHVAASYPAGTTRTQIMVDVVAAAQCVRGFIDPSIPERTYPAAVTIVGKIRDVLTELWAPDGAIWYLDGKTLNILAPGMGMPGTAPLISASTGLTGSPTRTDKGGVEVTCTLLPALKPGQPFVLQSRRVSGNFKASKVQHKLNSWGTVWETKIGGVTW